jgi:hypothetical protein
MARRQDSGSNSAHQNQRPTSHNEDAVPEMTDDTRGRADEGDEEEFEDADDIEETDENDEDTM